MSSAAILGISLEATLHQFFFYYDTPQVSAALKNATSECKNKVAFNKNSGYTTSCLLKQSRDYFYVAFIHV